MFWRLPQISVASLVRSQLVQCASSFSNERSTLRRMPITTHFWTLALLECVARRLVFLFPKDSFFSGLLLLDGRELFLFLWILILFSRSCFIPHLAP